MTGANESDRPHCSRRRLLKLSGAAAGGVIGLSATAEPASATDCPRPAEYWAVHEWPPSMPDPYTVGGVTKPVDDWQAFLTEPAFGDTAVMMAQHLIPAQVNFWRRPPEDPKCVDQHLEIVDWATMRDVKSAAIGWLNWSHFDDPDTRQDDWVVTVVDEPVDGLPIATALAAFNKGTIEALGCPCTTAESRVGVFASETGRTRSRAERDVVGTNSNPGFDRGGHVPFPDWF